MAAYKARRRPSGQAPLEFFCALTNFVVADSRRLRFPKTSPATVSAIGPDLQGWAVHRHDATRMSEDEPMRVLPPRVTDSLAERIERAYLLRRPQSRRYCAHADVWSMAAATLLEEHRRDPTIPLDPELYVAAQATDQLRPDPWPELTGAGPGARYSRRVHQIVQQLRSELRGEIRLVDRLLRRGGSIESLASTERPELTPLSRYVVAYRAGRTDLMQRLGPSACEQHWNCPLYRHACAGWLPDSAYPVPDIVPGVHPTGQGLPSVPCHNLN
jgi:hypothetical protein